MEKEMPSLADWLTVAEAAHEACITKAAVHNAIDRGRLQAEDKAGVKLIHRTEFERYRKEARRGRPRRKLEDTGGPQVGRGEDVEV
jgi:hypothetical protein